MNPRALAQAWMEIGARVVPLRGNKAPVEHLVPNGFHGASNNSADLWWFDHDDTELVGVVPGSIGALVLDVDVKGETNGMKTLLDVEQEHAPLDKPLRVTTRSGGWHYWYAKPDPRERVGNSDLCPAVNVRSDGGYVVAPGNPDYTAYVGLNGYRWRPLFVPGLFARELKENPAATAPAWLVERLHKAAEPAPDGPYDAPDARLEDEWHPKVEEAYERFEAKGDRHTSMLEAVGALASYELLGYAGATSALRRLEENFTVAVLDRSTPSEARLEYRRALDGARKRVRENKSLVLEDQKADREFVEAIIREHGGDDEDVQRVVDKVEEAQRLRLWTMRELMQQDLRINWLVRNVLITPTYGQIAGEKKTLKTYLSQYLAIAVASGEKFMGYFPVDRPGKVILFVGEGGRIPWTRRLPRIARSVGISDVRDLDIYASFQTAPLLSPVFKETVRDALDTLDPVLTIIDPYYAFHGAETDSKSIHEEGALLTAVAAPFVDHGSTLLIVNHFNKSSGGRGLNRITMSASGEWVDSWMLTEEREPPDLNDGDFYITAEFGSRQWGGSKWDLDLNIGRPNPDGTESDDPIKLVVNRNYA